MSDIIRTSLEGVKEFAEKDTFIGDVIVTPSGVSIIPVSRVNIGFATGGIDYANKRISPTQNFGGGGGTGISITPVAFLTVSPDAQVNLIPLAESSLPSAVDRVADVIESTPRLIQKIKEALF
ncbi:MAG: sporulation protein YtfJ [Clostridia bacterium]|nr:sporulation protein YtfJ [Clostridia bacterium]